MHENHTGLASLFMFQNNILELDSWSIIQNYMAAATFFVSSILNTVSSDQMGRLLKGIYFRMFTGDHMTNTVHHIPSSFVSSPNKILLPRTDFDILKFVYYRVLNPPITGETSSLLNRSLRVINNKCPNLTSITQLSWIY